MSDEKSDTRTVEEILREAADVIARLRRMAYEIEEGKVKKKGRK